jgi:hypothetical protein
MKRILLAILSVAMVLMTGCKKDENSEEGKWYAYEKGDATYTRLYIELNDGKADLIITAWGDRYNGTYTYDAAEGKLVINNATQTVRGNAGELGDKSTLTSNLFNDWPGATSADHIHLGSTIEMGFKVNGNTATCSFVGLEMEMTRQ